MPLAKNQKASRTFLLGYLSEVRFLSADIERPGGDIW